MKEISVGLKLRKGRDDRSVQRSDDGFVPRGVVTLAKGLLQLYHPFAIKYHLVGDKRQIEYRRATFTQQLDDVASIGRVVLSAAIEHIGVIGGDEGVGTKENVVGIDGDVVATGADGGRQLQ